MKYLNLILLVAAAAFASCTPESTQGTEGEELKDEVNRFLAEYSNDYQSLYYTSAKADWELNTHIVEGDTMAEYVAAQASKKYAEFTGGINVINEVRGFLAKRDSLTDLQVRQLEKILYMAGNNPEDVKPIVDERIKAEKAQTKQLFGYKYILNGDTVSTNYIDSILGHSKNLTERLAAWQESKEVGRVLKPGLANLQRLRNETVKGLGYSDYFSYQVSDYGMDTEEMLELNRQLIREIWPLYRELHTYARYELANRYGAKQVPEYLPAHWLPNRWGQDWQNMVEVEGLNLDSALNQKSREWIMKKGEEFYVSLGFDPLPEAFYERSSLYPLPKDAGYQKNNHASAWHMDLDEDVRCLMSVEPNADWWETVNHELGHIYYYMSYTNPDVPLVLREGANRAFHEAIGSQIGLAAMQRSYLVQQGLISEDSKSDEMRKLLKEAMNYIVFIPWSAGVMTEFEHDLYVQNLPEDNYNSRWWELKRKYQGIVPPAERGSEFADAASKTHINDDAAQYYDYALSFVLLYQFHDHIARNILDSDPRDANYYGNREVGDFIRELLEPGATQDWRELLREKLGEDISARAMLEYFNPLMEYLKEQNQGREYTLPEEPAAG